MPVDDLKVKDSFWNRYISLVRNVVIPYQWEALNDRIEGAEPSHCIENFKIAAGEKEGDFSGRVFQDSDLAKWIEASSYILSLFPDTALEEQVDRVVELIGKAQRPDGYINTYFTLKEPGKRWENERDKHELYCAGHLIEAAVAYYESTGKRKFLDIVSRYADYIDSVFGTEEYKKHGYPGHQEIELALIRLYHATGNKKYLGLSKYFIDERGKEPNFFKAEAELRAKKYGADSLLSEPYYPLFKDGYEYNQAHVPVRSQTKAVGHAVRAMYMYSAMADLAVETSDKALANACKMLWENVTESQMYITGGIGSDEFKESFSFDYDLPSDRAYAETCASVGLVFWARRMLNIDMDSKYADILERALYNGVISGISLDGRSFFYVNPLEVWPEACRTRHDLAHVEAVRQKWFGCACCPPNIARLLASIGNYIYSMKDNEVYVHLYTSSEFTFRVHGQDIILSQEGNYPWDGNINLSITLESPYEFTIALRIPGWCSGAKLAVNGQLLEPGPILNKGYAEIKRVWQNGDHIKITLPMPVERMQANPNVRADSGKVAIQRGPVVYCIEEADNGPNLNDICLPKDRKFEAYFDDKLLGGVMVITGEAIRSNYSNWNGTLYRRAEYDFVPVIIKAIPYFAWSNREPGEMLVWLREYL